MTKTHHAVAQARELLAALDQQLTAASSAESDEARERVSALTFGLTALLEQLGAQAPDNDQQLPAPRETRGLADLFEEFEGKRDRVYVVARFMGRWFVAEGYAAQDKGTWAVEYGPYLKHEDARCVALQLHHWATGKGPWSMPQVVQA